MTKLSIAQARLPEAIGQDVVLQGWVRTRRDSKAGFSFLELNDGSCFGNIQVIAETTLPNYESEIKRLTAGSSVSVEGEVRESPGKGQATEVLARRVTVHGAADVETYALQKKTALVRVPSARSPICDLGPTPSARSPGCVTAFAGRSTISSRRRASSTSTRPSSPPATVKGPARCSR